MTLWTRLRDRIVRKTPAPRPEEPKTIPPALAYAGPRLAPPGPPVTVRTPRPATHQEAVDFVNDIKIALSQGTVQDPDHLLDRDSDGYEKMARDYKIRQVVDYRSRLVAGQEWALEPASSNPDDAAVAEILADCIRPCRRFSQVRRQLAEAFLRGLSVARIDGEFRDRDLGGRGLRRYWVLTACPPMDKRRFRLEDDPDHEGEKRWTVHDFKSGEWIVLDRPEAYIWHRYEEEERGLGYGLGLGEALYHLWRARVLLWQYLNQHAGRWSQGMVDVAIDHNATLAAGSTLAGVVTQYLELLPAMQSRHILCHDSEDKVSVLEPGSAGGSFLRSTLEWLDTCVAALVLNANLPTTASAGGSYALAEVQASSTESTILADRELLDETLTHDLVSLVYSLNLPTLRASGLNPTACPRFQTRASKPTSSAERGAALDVALNKLRLPVSRAEAYRLLDLTPPADGEDVLTPPAPALPGPPGPSPFRAAWARAAKPAHDELSELLDSNALRFREAIQAHIRALVEGADTKKTLAAVQTVTAETCALADVLGRRRLLLEVRGRAQYAAGTDLPLPRVPFAEALKALTTSGLFFNPEQTAQMIREAYLERPTFAAVAAANTTMVSQVRDAVVRALGTGETEDLAGRVIADLTDWTESYARTVYRTNVCGAYTTGRFAQASDPDVADLVAGFEFMATDDEDCRPGHLACNGMRAPVDHPIWDRLAPPLGYNCRCTVRAITTMEAQENGWLDRAGRLVPTDPGADAGPDYPEFGHRPHGGLA